MESTDASERSLLIETKKEPVAQERRHHNHHLLNLKQAFLVILGVMMGAGTLLMPFAIRQLGIVGWFFTLAITVTMHCTTTILLGRSTVKVIEDSGGIETNRDPYQFVAEKSCGRILRVVSVVFIYIALLTSAMSLLLVSASILSNLVPIPGIQDANVMRMWSTVLVVMLTPITYLGTYSELKLPAVVAVTTALTSVCLIILNSLLYKFVFVKPGDFSKAKVQSAEQIFFIPLGTVLFSSAGPFTAPNLASLAASPAQLDRSFVAAYVFMFIVLAIAGMVPYLVFGDIILPSIVSTFYRVINDKQHQDDSAVFLGITITIEVLMMIHLCMAIVLIMNPLFLHMEEAVGIPREFTLKRVGVRTSFMVFSLAVCLLVPHFESILSLTGGVPYAVIGIIIPFLVYMNLFLTMKYQRVLVYLLLFVVTALIVGNFVTSAQQIVVTL